MELLQFEIGVYGWCTSSTNSIKIIICFQVEEGDVLTRESIKIKMTQNSFENMHLHHMHTSSSKNFCILIG